MVRGYIQHTDHVVLVMEDASLIPVYPHMLSGGKTAYMKMLLLLHRMRENMTAAEIINRFAKSLKDQ